MLEVIHGGVLTTVQDLGRRGYLHMGIPRSGAFDAFSLKVANHLVENDPSEAGLETMLPGLRLKALSETAVAITGADLGPQVNGKGIKMWSVVSLSPGDTLSFSKVNSGCRAYIAIAGGVEVPKVLGSKSTFVRGGFGGHEGRPLRRGDIICTGESCASISDMEGRSARPDVRRSFIAPIQLRVVRGLEHHLFESTSVDLFFSAEFKVTSQADRMGVRYHGPEVNFKPRDKATDYEAGADPSNILNECIPMGGIQVVSGKEPIILGVDGPSTGGYAKIGTVISPDLSLVAQSKPGDSTFFREISLGEAHRILLQEKDLLKKVIRN